MSHWLGMDFPWGTLAVNVLGSFAMGILISVFAHFWQPPQEIKLLLVTGFLGAFTTFSTFSLDFTALCGGGRVETALMYMSASVIVSIGALLAGLHIVRAFV
jgi:CrcB protein